MDESNGSQRGGVLPRVVFFELQEAEAASRPREFEVDLNLYGTVDRKTDFESIVRQMILNQPTMTDVFKNAKYQWKLAEKYFPDRFFDVEDEEIGFLVLQHQSFVKCFYERQLTSQQSQSSFSVCRYDVPTPASTSKRK